MNKIYHECSTSSGLQAGERKLILLPIVKLKLNRNIKVQECDATMFNQGIMLVNKKRKTKAGKE
jgi:hypothetical protein